MIYQNNVDFQKYQLLNAVLHKSTAAPSAPVAGQIYYNTTNSTIYIYDASTSQWIGIGQGSVTGVLGGNGLTATPSGSTVNLDVNVDNATLEISADVVRIKDNGVTTSKINDGAVTTSKHADGSVTTIKLTDSAITFAKIQDVPTMTVIGRVIGGTGQASGITIINDNSMSGATSTNLATAGSIKAYVDASIAGIGTLIGGFAAGSATQFPGTGTTKKGDYWYVTTAGTVQGVIFQVGDMLIANQAAPSNTNPAQWIFIQGNLDQATTTILGAVVLATAAEVNTGSDANKVVTPSTLSQRTATETRTGIAAIATQAEVNAGTNDGKLITPMKLSAFMNQYISGFAGTVGNGTLTSFTLTHNLGTRDLSWTLLDLNSNNLCWTNMSFPTVNT
ncbi:MAG: hypothetical protein EOO89_20905, partial [Pedobacter sp.]